MAHVVELVLHFRTALLERDAVGAQGPLFTDLCGWHPDVADQVLGQQLCQGEGVDFDLMRASAISLVLYRLATTT